MAINVNTVYTTVLSILNKEQRGYLTPYEFNQLATQVQLEIFESYFENLNQQLRVGENSSEYANRVKTLREKIAIFEVEEDITVAIVNGIGVGDLTTLTNTVHRLGTLHSERFNYLPVEIEQATKHQFNSIRRSNLTQPSAEWPVYYKEGNTVKILPGVATAAGPPAVQVYSVEYVKKPADVVWAYEVGALNQYIWDGTPGAVGPFIPALGSVSFEIDDTDQTELILKILMYAGVVVRDQEIVQAAAGAAAQADQLQSS